MRQPFLGKPEWKELMKKQKTNKKKERKEKSKSSAKK